MATYKRSAVTAKQGINFVRSTVEDAGSLFIKVEQENDLGIDALLELIKDERPLNQQIAVQIKSGQSYYNADANECVFPVGSHREYWEKHPLPVFGIVFVPALNTASWVDIKLYLKANPDATVIRYRVSAANRFDGSSFSRLFVPAVVRETPTLTLEEAFAFARSDKQDEQYLGLLVLFRKYPNVQPTWDELVRFFVERPRDEIPHVLIYWLARIPGHGDISYFGEGVSESTRAYARTLLSRFGDPEVVKLLSFVDPENSISRGSIGQSVEAIISSLPRSSELLRRVLEASEVDLFIRECAVLILAMNEGPGVIEDLAALAASGSWYATEIISHLREYGSINPYA
jgi:Domain of unknown function (DUF4365)